MYRGEREAEMRSDLYHAVARGDIDAAQDVMNLMMLAGIDDFAIIKANKASRPAVADTEVKPFPLPQGLVGTFMASFRPEKKHRQAKGMERG